MIIVDSIASLVRKEYSGTWGRGIVDRTNFLAQQAAVLKYLAEFFQIPVSLVYLPSTEANLIYSTGCIVVVNLL